MDWLWVALPILVAVQLWLMYHIGHKRGYLDGYDVGYTEASRYYLRLRNTPRIADAANVAELNIDSESGDIARTVIGSEHE